MSYFGLSEDQFNYIQSSVIDPLLKKNAQVFCFGSRARGNFQIYSDLDLLIRVLHQDDDLLLLVCQIREKLEEENFPLKVDIVFEYDLAKSYQQNVMKEMVAWPVCL
jgi:predicted nucleotidyltransferase